jgi:hypothetical protein
MEVRADWGRLLFIGALAIVCANALVYAARQANPLITSDDWVYLDSFVRKAAASDLSLSDFFVKRSAMDHANPLRRLILLMHYEWFDLDYGVGGLIGVLFAFANLGLLWRTAVPEEGDPRRPWWFLLAFLSVAGVYLSLNAGTVYTWPLLTLAYSSQFFVLLCILAAWAANIRGTRRAAWMLLCTAFAMDVVADDTGLLASIGISLAALAWQCREKGRVEGVAVAARTVVLPMVAAYAVYKAMFLVVTGGEVIAVPLDVRPGLGDKLRLFAANPWELLSGLHIPPVAALMQKSRLVRMFGSHAQVAEWGLALSALCAHAWFWWRALTQRTRRAGFAAAVLMLYFYGALAGILVGRATVYGAQYFWQPRYVLLYQLSIVALMMMAIDAMFCADARNNGARRTPAVRAIAITVACALVLLQCRLSVWTWSGAQYSTGFQRKLARQIGELAAHPERVPKKCAPALIVCRYPIEQRKELVGFLKENKLNVFSPVFQARYRLYPEKPH